MAILASLLFAIICTSLVIYWERKAKRDKERERQKVRDMYDEGEWFK